MKSLAQWRTLVENSSLDQFVVANPTPFLICSLATRPLDAVARTRGLTIDRIVVPGSDPGRPATSLDDYLVGQLRSSRNSTAREITLGCSSLCDIQINDASVSKLHAYIVETPDGWHVRDATSLTGTRVNDEEPTAPLQSGDRVTCGLVDLTFLMPGELYQLVRQLARIK